MKERRSKETGMRLIFMHSKLGLLRNELKMMLNKK
jgi:hypothetical protein